MRPEVTAASQEQAAPSPLGLQGRSIEAQGLEVWLGGRRVLGPVDLSWEAGTWNLITGDNGAGKTTLVRALAGLVALDAGWVRLGALTWGPGKTTPVAVAYLPQVLPPGDLAISVAEVAALGFLGRDQWGPGGRLGARDHWAARSAEKAEIAFALERVGLGGLERAAYRDLSGGERQRAHLARCLLQGSPFLFLDEPAASLDPGAKDRMLDLVEALARERGLSLVMVSHEAGHFDRPGWVRHPLTGGLFA